MKDRVNTYIAVLFITIAGAGAASLIVHIATTDTVTSTLRGTEAQNYAALQRSLLQSQNR